MLEQYVPDKSSFNASYEQIVKLLIENEDVNVNAKDDYGYTALCYAAVKGKKLHYINISDATKLSSARLSSDLARARGLSARLGSAQAIFEPARVLKIQLGF